MFDGASSRALRRRSRQPGWMAVLAALLLVPAVASAGEPASQSTQAHATIDFPLSITSNQDIVVASIMLRSSQTMAGRQKRDRDNNSVTSTELTRASFLIAGRVDLAVSVEISPQIYLINADGTTALTAETVITQRADVMQPQNTLNERGLMLLNILSRVLLKPVAVSGSYRGILVAIAQYN